MADPAFGTSHFNTYEVGFLSSVVESLCQYEGRACIHVFKMIMEDLCRLKT